MCVYTYAQTHTIEQEILEFLPYSQLLPKFNLANYQQLGSLTMARFRQRKF